MTMHFYHHRRRLQQRAGGTEQDAALGPRPALYRQELAISSLTLPARRYALKIALQACKSGWIETSLGEEAEIHTISERPSSSPC
jgi:hypothetical protein